MLLLAKCGGLVLWPCFVMLLILVAHKVWWFSVWPCFVMVLYVLRTKCFDLILWCYCLLFLTKYMYVMVLCFDLALWCFCLLLLRKCDGLVFDLILWCYYGCCSQSVMVKCFWPDFCDVIVVVAHKMWWLSGWPCFVMLLFVVAHNVLCFSVLT